MRVALPQVVGYVCCASACRTGCRIGGSAPEQERLRCLLDQHAQPFVMRAACSDFAHKVKAYAAPYAMS